MITHGFRSLPLAVACCLGLLASLGGAPGAVSAPSRTSAWLHGWPMVGHDPQRTNRSPIDGPVHPRLLWSIPGIQVNVVGPDGTLYGCAHDSTVALSAGGETLWSYPACFGPALLAPDGTLLEVGFTRRPATSADEIAAGLSSSGTLAWKIQPFGQLKGTEPLATSGNLFYVPVIGPHDGSPGQAYIGLNIISSHGKVLRRLPRMDQLAVGPKGQLYDAVGGIAAATSRGRPLWHHYFSSKIETEPLVGRHGIIYVGYGRRLAAYRPAGQLRWRLAWPDQPLTLAERADGVLLVAGRRELGAVSPTGTVLWRIRTGVTAVQDRADWPALVVDSAGMAYLATGDGVVRLVSPAGKVVARLAGGTPGNSLFLDPQGRLIVNGMDGVLRVFGRTQH